MRPHQLVFCALTGALIPFVVSVPKLRAQQVELKAKEKVKRDRYVITADEITERPDLSNAYDVIKSLRSQWLRVVRGSGRALTSADPTAAYRPDPDKIYRGCGSDCPKGEGGAAVVPHESGSPYAESGATTLSAGAAGPVLYVNEIKQEGLNDLKNIRPGEIMEMHYMTGTEASGRYGAGHESGAILIRLKTKAGA